MSHRPIFQSIFAESWNALPPVMHKHYANRPYSRDQVTTEGIMEVHSSRIVKLLGWPLRLLGALVPYEGTHIPVTVHFRSSPTNDSYGFDRIFHFPGKKPVHFRSRMFPLGGNEVIECMRFGIGWRAAYRFDGTRVLLEHRGYGIRIGRLILPLPLAWVLGRGSAHETAQDDGRFHMQMDIYHPWFGITYGYSGDFTITKVHYA